MDEMGTATMVGIKIPAFMETDAAGWFVIIEAHFCLRKVTHIKTNFYKVHSALPPELVTKIQASILTKKK